MHPSLRASLVAAMCSAAPLRSSVSRCAMQSGWAMTRASARSALRIAGPTACLLGRRAASSSPSLSSSDPTLSTALRHLEAGTALLESGDLSGARAEYARSVQVQRTPEGYFNLGVVEYSLKNVEGAIGAWKEALGMRESADAHTNLASAYILSQPPQAAAAIRHLKQALELEPNDPEIAFNLAAVLESTGNLAPALKLYQRAVDRGIKRAEQNVLNVSAKLAAAKKGESPAGKAGA